MQEGMKQPCRRQGNEDPDANSRSHQNPAPLNDLRDDSPGSETKGDSDSPVFFPPLHEMRDDAVDPDRAEKEGDPGEHGEQQHDLARRANRESENLVHRGRLLDCEPGSDAFQGRSRGAENSARVRPLHSKKETLRL